MKFQLLETVREPRAVFEGHGGALLAVRHYPNTSIGSKFLVVVYRETAPDDGFIVTAYRTNRLPQGESGS